MSAPTTDIEIMSNAAVLLGKRAFTTIEDADEFAVSLQKFYDMLVPSELTQSHWKFAKKYVQLSKVSNFTPDFAEWSTAYDLPGDLLAVVRIYPNVNYEIFGQRLYTGASGVLKMEYTYQVPVSQWPAPFKTFIVYSLAENLAFSVAEDPKLAQMLESKRQEMKAQAMWVDAQSAPNKAIRSKPWINARRVASNNFDYFNEGN